jgi:hypothetical protein
MKEPSGHLEEKHTALANCGLVKITCSSSEVVLRTMKRIMIYPGLGPSSKVTALCPVL